MMMSDDKVGGWVKKGQNHDDVILECPHMRHPVYKIIDNSSSEQIQKKHLRKYANIFIKIPEKPMKRCSGFTYTESSHNANFCIS